MASYSNNLSMVWLYRYIPSGEERGIFLFQMILPAFAALTGWGGEVGTLWYSINACCMVIEVCVVLQPGGGPRHGLIKNYIDTKAKCRLLKIFTCKGTFGTGIYQNL